MEIRYRSNLTAGIISVGLGMLCWIIIPYQIGEDYALTYGITSKTIPYAVSVLWIICGAALIIQSLVFKREEIKTLESLKVGFHVDSVDGNVQSFLAN